MRAAPLPPLNLLISKGFCFPVVILLPFPLGKVRNIVHPANAVASTWGVRAPQPAASRRGWGVAQPVAVCAVMEGVTADEPVGAASPTSVVLSPKHASAAEPLVSRSAGISLLHAFFMVSATCGIAIAARTPSITTTRLTVGDRKELLHAAIRRSWGQTAKGAELSPDPLRQ